MSGLLLLIPPCRRRCSPCMHLKAGAGGFRREVQPRRQHWFLNEKSGFPSRTPAFCSVSRGQRRLGEKEYRAPSVTPGVALRPRTQGSALSRYAIRPKDSRPPLASILKRLLVQDAV